MFNNIIYFIVALLIFNISVPEPVPDESRVLSLVMLPVSWAAFAAYCGLGFRKVLWRIRAEAGGALRSGGHFTALYHALTVRLSVLALFVFAVDVHLFNLKLLIRHIPGCASATVLEGSCALALFVFFLCTIWYFAHPVYSEVFRAGTTRRSFIGGNVKLNLPILFPWFLLSLASDLLGLTPWGDPDGFLESAQGQLAFFALFLLLLMVFMPGFIQYWWGCRPLAHSEKGRRLEEFLREKRFRYRRLVNWPIFEGRMMTAGIMGIVSRFRYLLVTDSLMELLTVEELEAVLAHEMGHARYRHLLWYVVFFIGFMVLSYGMYDVFVYLLYFFPSLITMLSGEEPGGLSLVYAVLSVPMLVALLVYFRFIMGFFMRNFERQADLYAAVTMGTAVPIITSLEKIAFFSGKSRNLPSWHHFSIRERVEFLGRAETSPGLVRRHNRFVAGAFALYLIGVAGTGYFLNFSRFTERMNYSLLERVLIRQLEEGPAQAGLYRTLAMVYHQTEKYTDAVALYDKAIELEPGHAVSLNNLAWLLATAPVESVRDPARAVALAKRAVALDRSAMFLDTLAEAYYAGGRLDDAVAAGREALSSARERRGYYERQVKKFMDARQG